MHGNATATEDQQVSAQYENEINEIGKYIKLKQICLSFGEKNRVRIMQESGKSMLNCYNRNIHNDNSF